MKSLFLNVVLMFLLVMTAETKAQTNTQEAPENQHTEETSNQKKGGIDWFQTILLIGYLGGGFILLPIVVYTNYKEQLKFPSENDRIDADANFRLQENEKTQTAIEILDKIESRLTSYQSDDGSKWITITKGSQAKFVKHGIDYIHKQLNTNDQTILSRVNEISEVYNDRTKRTFTGSYPIIITSAALSFLIYHSSGISFFLFIHLLGLAFYILSSRTPFYALEKRMKYYNSSFAGSIFVGLFAGNKTKHYVKQGEGPWKRDHETEFQMMGINLIIIIIVAMILGFLTAFLGVINFFINYLSSFLLPFENEVDWYQKNFNH